MGYAVQIQHQVVVECIQCANCGQVFGITADLMRRRREDHAAFYCPLGHSNVYDGETEAERLRRMLAEANAKNTQLADRARNAELAEDKAVKETRRIKRRVQAGVCPCCNRTFTNLARHMKTKHAPTTTESESPK